MTAIEPEVVQTCASPEEAARVFLAVYDRKQYMVVGSNICVKAVSAEDHGYVPHVTRQYTEPGEDGPKPIDEPVKFTANTVSLVIGGHRQDFELGPEKKDISTSSPVGGPPLGFAPIQRGVDSDEDDEEQEKPHTEGDIVLPAQRIPLEPRRTPRQGKADAGSSPGAQVPAPKAPDDGRGDSSGVRSIPDARHHRLRLGSWENALANLLRQHFDRQERVVKAKLTGAKLRERWEANRLERKDEDSNNDDLTWTGITTTGEDNDGTQASVGGGRPAVEEKEWDEADHPRDADGRFGSGDGSTPVDFTGGGWTDQAKADVQAGVDKFQAAFPGAPPVERILNVPDLTDKERPQEASSAHPDNRGMIVNQGFIDEDPAERAKAAGWSVRGSANRTGVVIHELGHRLDMDLLHNHRDLYDQTRAYLHEKIKWPDGTEHERIKSGGFDEPSAYATENEREYIAEALADHVLNGDDAKDGGKPIAAIFKQAYGPKPKSESKDLNDKPKPLVAKKPPVHASQIFDKDTWKDALRADMSGMLNGIWEDFGQDAADTYGVDWTMDSPDVEAAIGKQLDNVLLIEDTTQNQIQRALERSFHSGDDMPALVERLSSVFETARNLRAPMIAQQQTVAAGNGAIVSVGDQSDGNFTSKTWHTQEDEKVRPTHADAEGQTVPIDSTFSVGDDQLDYPGDPSGSPAEVINCRCWATLGPKVPPVPNTPSGPVVDLTKAVARFDRKLLREQSSADFRLAGFRVPEYTPAFAFTTQVKDVANEPRDESGRWTSEGGGWQKATAKQVMDRETATAQRSQPLKPSGDKYTAEDLHPAVGSHIEADMDPASGWDHLSGTVSGIRDPQNVMVTTASGGTTFINPAHIQSATISTARDPKEIQRTARDLVKHSDVYYNGDARATFDKSANIPDDKKQQVMDALTNLNRLYPDRARNLEVGPHNNIRDWGIQGATDRGGDTIKLAADVLDDNSYNKANNEPLRVLYHEFGHTVDTSGERSPKTQHALDTLAPGTEYGNKNPHEAYADSFMLWHTSNGKTQDPLANTLAKSEGWHKYAKSSFATQVKDFTTQVKDWDPDLHPRDEQGRFTSGDGGENNALSNPNLSNGSIKPTTADMQEHLGEKLTFTSKDGDKITGTVFDATDKNGQSYVHFAGNVSIDYPDGDHEDNVQISKINLANVRAIEGPSTGSKPTPTADDGGSDETTGTRQQGTPIEPTGKDGKYYGTDLKPFKDQQVALTLLGKDGKEHEVTGTVNAALSTIFQLKNPQGDLSQINHGGDDKLTMFPASDILKASALGAAPLSAEELSKGLDDTLAGHEATGTVPPTGANGKYTTADLEPLTGKPVTISYNSGTTFNGTILNVSQSGPALSGTMHYSNGTTHDVNGAVSDMNYITAVEVTKVTTGTATAPAPTSGAGYVTPTGGDGKYTNEDLQGTIGHTVSMDLSGGNHVDGQATGWDPSAEKLELNGKITYPNGEHYEADGLTVYPSTVTKLSINDGTGTQREPSGTLVKPTGDDGKYTEDDLENVIGQRVKLVYEKNGTTFTGTIGDDHGDLILHGTMTYTSGGSMDATGMPVVASSLASVQVLSNTQPAAVSTSSEPTGTPIQPTGMGGKYMAMDLYDHLGKDVTAKLNGGITVIGKLVDVGNEVGVKKVYFGPDARMIDEDGTVQSFENGKVGLSHIQSITINNAGAGKPSTDEGPSAGSIKLTPDNSGPYSKWTDEIVNPHIGKTATAIYSNGMKVVGTIKGVTDDGYLHLENAIVTKPDGSLMDNGARQPWEVNGQASVTVEGTRGEASGGEAGGATHPSGPDGKWTEDDLKPYIGHQVTLTDKTGLTATGKLSSVDPHGTYGTTAYFDGNFKLKLSNGTETEIPGDSGLILDGSGKYPYTAISSPEVDAEGEKPSSIATGKMLLKEIGGTGPDGKITSADLKPLKGEGIVVWTKNGIQANGWYGKTYQGVKGTLVSVGPKFATVKISSGYKYKVPVDDIKSANYPVNKDDVKDLAGKTISLKDTSGNTLTATVDNPNATTGMVLSNVKGFTPSGSVIEKPSMNVPLAVIGTIHEGISPEVATHLSPEDVAKATTSAPKAIDANKGEGPRGNYSSDQIHALVGKTVKASWPDGGFYVGKVVGEGHDGAIKLTDVQNEDGLSLDDVQMVPPSSQSHDLMIPKSIEVVGGGKAAAAAPATPTPKSVDPNKGEGSQGKYSSDQIDALKGKTVKVTFPSGIIYTGTVKGPGDDGAIKVEDVHVTDEHGQEGDLPSIQVVPPTSTASYWSVPKSVEVTGAPKPATPIKGLPTKMGQVLNTPVGEKKYHWGDTIVPTGGDQMTPDHTVADLAPHIGHTITVTKQNGDQVTGKLSNLGIAMKQAGGDLPTFKVGNQTFDLYKEPVAKIEAGDTKKASPWGDYANEAPEPSPNYDKTKPSATPEPESDGVDRSSAAEAKKAGFATSISKLKDELAGKGMKPHEAEQAARGRSILYDGKDVEDLDVRVSKVKDEDGKDFYEMKFKMMPNQFEKLKDAINKPDSNWGQSKMVIQRKDFTGSGFNLNKSPAYKSDRGRTAYGNVEGAEVQVHYVPDQYKSNDNSPYAYDRTVQVRVPAADFTDDKVNKIMSALGVRAAGHAQAQDVDALRQAKFESFTHGPKSPGLAAQAGITDASHIQITKSGSGRVEPRLSEEDGKNLAKVLNTPTFYHDWSGSGTIDDVLDALKSGQPNVSTTNRWAEGIGKSGMSSSEDVHTGGADYVFTRQSSHDADEVGHHQSSPIARLVYNGAKMLQRPDMYSYQTDKFGKARGYDYEHRDSLRSVKEGHEYSDSNGGHETMFKGRTSNDDLEGVYVNNAGYRDKLVNGLKEAGITHIAGKPVEDMIKLS